MVVDITASGAVFKTRWHEKPRSIPMCEPGHHQFETMFVRPVHLASISFLTSRTPRVAPLSSPRSYRERDFFLDNSVLVESEASSSNGNSFCSSCSARSQCSRSRPKGWPSWSQILWARSAISSWEMEMDGLFIVQPCYPLSYLFASDGLRVIRPGNSPTGLIAVRSRQLQASDRQMGLCKANELATLFCALFAGPGTHQAGFLVMLVAFLPADVANFGAKQRDFFRPV